MKFLILLVLCFLILGAFFIVSNENLSLSLEQNRAIFTEKYTSWLSHLFDNSKQITGYVVNSKWLPEKLDSLNKTAKR